MRATDGRPYELQSVPTKTVAVRSTDNCADLVQNLVCTVYGMGLPIPLAMGLVGTEIYIVGASIARPFFIVSSAITGRDAATTVLAAAYRRYGDFLYLKSLNNEYKLDIQQ